MGKTETDNFFYIMIMMRKQWYSVQNTVCSEL